MLFQIQPRIRTWLTLYACRSVFGPCLGMGAFMARPITSFARVPRVHLPFVISCSYLPAFASNSSLIDRLDILILSVIACFHVNAPLPDTNMFSSHTFPPEAWSAPLTQGTYQRPYEPLTTSENGSIPQQQRGLVMQQKSQVQILDQEDVYPPQTDFVPRQQHAYTLCDDGMHDRVEGLLFMTG